MNNPPDAEQFDRVVQKIDDAEQALSQMYYLVIGRSPQWSKTFGHQEALDEVKDAMAAIRAARLYQFREDDCPGHVASDDPKVCRLCGTHIDSLRIDDHDETP